MTKITELLDKYMPLRRLTQKEYERRFKPWITDKLLDKIDKKNKAFRKYMNCKGTLEIKTQMHIEFKIIKNEITNLTRQSKKSITSNISLKILQIYKKSGKESKIL